MGELRQHHPSLRISKVKALQKGDLLVVGDSPRDAVILQSEPKMKAALGKNVRVSLPKAYQTTKQQNKCLVVKGVPTDLTDVEFKEFLDLTLSGPGGGGGSEARMAKLTAVNQKPLIL